MLTELLGIPKRKNWIQKVDPNHTITLKGIYGIWYNSTDQTSKIIYGCGSIVPLKDGQLVDHYFTIKHELPEMAKQVLFKNSK